ncbi:glycoside hydrolase family 98 domain-containing protein, partial [Aquimarina aggregata]
MKLKTLKPCIQVLLFFLLHFSQAQPKLVSPRNGMTMTQIAASFKAQTSVSGPYHIEISKDPNFKTGVIRQSVNSTGKDTGYLYFYFYDKPQYSQLTKGKWFWRVAEANKSRWSEVWSVSIDPSLPKMDPLRPISPKNPIFHSRITEVDGLTRIKELIPDDLKQHFTLDVPSSFPHLMKGKPVIEFCESVNNIGYPFWMDIGRPDYQNHTRVDRAVCLSEIEYVFQNYPNCIGVATGELFYEYFSSGDKTTKHFTDNVIELCAKYGKYFMLSDFNYAWSKWGTFSEMNYEKFKEKKLAPYFLPLYKTTEPDGALICMSAIQGMGLTGMVDNYGMWSDAWLWQKFGQPGVFDSGKIDDFPYIFNMKTFLLSYTQGGTVTGIEPDYHWGIWSAKPNENQTKYLLPFLRGVLNHNIIVGKKAIKKATKVMINVDVDVFREGIEYNHSKYGPLFENTYGLYKGGNNPTKEEIIPNTSRYLGIPFLPHKNASTPAGMKLINLTDVQTKAQVSSLINPLYPENGNEAYTFDMENTLVVLNTFENTDKHQAYEMKLGNSGIKKMEGSIPLMSYIMGKREIEKKQYWFQVNGYTKGANTGGKYNLSEYPTIITFTCSKRPTLKSDQMSAFIRQDWDEA